MRKRTRAVRAWLISVSFGGKKTRPLSPGKREAKSQQGDAGGGGGFKGRAGEEKGGVRGGGGCARNRLRPWAPPKLPTRRIRHSAGCMRSIAPCSKDSLLQSLRIHQILFQRRYIAPGRFV